jgi:hypothetical protein
MANDLEMIKKEIDYQHSNMLTEIQNNLPQIEKLSSNFGKTQSQFMDNMLTTSHPTPIRNIRQILAEINKSLEALREAYYKNKKEEIEIKKLQRKLKTEKDDLELDIIKLDIEEKATRIEIGKKYVMGAIRKINNYNKQYDSILKTLGVNSFDEIDFEKEEEEYHIKKAFEQGLNAARVNGGRIDEGNQIYLTQIGINGTVATKCVQGFLIWEEQQLSKGIEPTAEDQWRFLEEMYQKFKGCAIKYAEKKGMILLNDEAMITKM